MLDAVRPTLTRLGEFTTHPTAFAVVLFTVAWLIFSPEPFRLLGWCYRVTAGITECYAHLKWTHQLIGRLRGRGRRLFAIDQTLIV
jgi:hypothetical protein